MAELTKVEHAADRRRCRVRLGDVCTVVSGSTPKTSVKEYWNGTIRWVTPAEIEDDTRWLSDTAKHITDEGFTSANLTMMPAGTVLLSSRAPIGKLAITTEPMCCNQGFKNLICSDEVLNEYLFWHLKAKVQQLQSLGRGATFKELSKKAVEDYRIWLPPIDEQNAIASHLSAIDSLKVNLMGLSTQFDTVIKSRFIEMCKTVQCERVPISCFVSRDIVPVSKRYSADDEISYIDISSIDSANHRVKRTQKMPVSKAPSRAQQCVRDGDLLVSTVRPALRNIAQVKTGKANLVASSGFCVLRANSCPVEYLLANLLMDDFSDAMCLVATGASYPAIKKQDVLNYRVPNLPYEQMVELSSYMRQVDKLRFDVQQQIEKLETLKKSLMQEYFD